MSWWSFLDILEVAVGVVAGGLINWVFSRRSSRELRREAGDLRHYVNALISYLEAAGQIRVTRDADGRPIEVWFLRGGGISSPRSASAGSGTLTVAQPEERREPDPPQSREEGS